MKTSFLLFCACCLILNYCEAQASRLDIQKQLSLGGSFDDDCRSIDKTSDGGYIVAGGTSSNDGNVSGNHNIFSKSDAWVVKLTKQGDIEWQKCLGGSGNDYAYCIQQTTDRGYILAGETASNDGDVSGNHGGTDYWVVKLTAAGAIAWQVCLGGSSREEAYSIQQTTDSGYIVAGYSYSADGNVTGHYGDGSDYWVVKLTKSGQVEWQKSLGGNGEDYGYSVAQTTDGGYIASGASQSNDGDVSGNHGSSDAWTVKLNSAGAIQWQKSLGGGGYDDGAKIEQAADGGYIMAGNSSSNNGDVSGNHGGNDYWVVKLNTLGNIQWQTSLGGADDDQCQDIGQTKDGGYAVVGSSVSNDGDVSGNHGGSDYWVVKLNQKGKLQGQGCYGGSNYEDIARLQLTNDGSGVIAGSSYSSNGDVSGHHGSEEYEDFCLIKLKPFTASPVTAGYTNRIFPDNKPIILTSANPSANGVFTADLGGQKNNVYITVTDNAGRQVYTDKKASAAQVSIRLNSQAKGVYYLQVRYDGGKQTANLLIK